MDKNAPVKDSSFPRINDRTDKNIIAQHKMNLQSTPDSLK